MVTTIITAMAAYSNERVAAIVISVLYRMLTEVWKYGETIHGDKRYSPNSYERTNFDRQDLFYGTKTEILIQEKIMLYWYYFEHGQLPPGNKRFK